MKKEMIVCGVTASVSLVVAAVCHRFFPGLGAALKPLLWPLVPMAVLVRTRTALAAALAIPLLSAAVNGMPEWSVAFRLSLVGVGLVGAVAGIRAVVRAIGAKVSVR